MPEAGDILAQRYLIVRLLGQGGMGSVFEARHTGTGRRVALKLISKEMADQPAAVARFEAEAKTAGAIESQYIAQVMDVGKDADRGDVSYLVMEYLEGEDLQHLISRLGPLPQDLALRIAGQVCLGLEKAHAFNVVHRDIKPANIFLTEREGDFVVKILDFGIAKLRGDNQAQSSSLTRTGSLIGSPLYMSPEQALGHKNIDQRSDLWSLGIVLFDALAGSAPRAEIEAIGELIFAVCSEPNESVQVRAPWVRPEVANIVEKALAINAANRYQTAGEMLTALRALLPAGVGIDRSMLVPLTEEERATTAPTTVRAPYAALAHAAPPLELPRGADPLDFAKTRKKQDAVEAAFEAKAAAALETGAASIEPAWPGSAVTVTSEGPIPGLPSKRSNAGLLVAAVVVLLVGVGLSVLLLGSSHHPTASTAGTATLDAPTPTAAGTAAALAAAPGPAPVTVSPTSQPTGAVPPAAPAVLVAPATGTLTSRPPGGLHGKMPSGSPKGGSGKPYDPTAEP